MFIMRAAVERRGSRLVTLAALWLILVGGFFVGGCAEARSSSNASRVLAATPTPESKVPVRPEFDSVRIVAEQELSEDSYGSKIAFTKLPDWLKGRPIGEYSPWHDLWIADGDGSNQRLLVRNASVPTFSLDGRWLYYSASDPREIYDSGVWDGGMRAITSTDLYRIRPDGTEKARLYSDSPNSGILVPPCTMPDNNLAVLRSNRSIAFFDPLALRHLESRPDVNNIWRFWCSSDGKFVAYMMGPRLWIGAVDGTSRQFLGENGDFDNLVVSWSSGGNSLVYNKYKELWVYGSDGSNGKKVVDVDAFPESKAEKPRGGSIGTPLLSSDGRLAFVSFSSGQQDNRKNTYVVDVSTGRVKLFAENKILVSLSPDGTKGVLMSVLQTPDKRLAQPLTVATIAP